MTFDGSSIDGFSRIQEADVLAVPDANTFVVLPWGDPKPPRRASSATSITSTAPRSTAIRRQVLKRHVRAAHAQGLTFYVAPDIEFFYFESPKPGERPRPLDEASFFDLTTNDVTGSLRRQTIRTLETMGIPVEYSFHEDAPSQQEIDLRHTDALTMADSVMTFRLIVRELAAAQGLHATFMPKPLEGVQGSGMHTHMSLFRGDDNAFFDEHDDYNLSATAKSFMAGLLRHAAEITAITNQTVNSYKRLVPGFEAPVHVSWARNNRSGLIRVPIAKRNNPLATRVEYRSPDPACNPYLTFALILAAGMRGVEEGYELPAEADANLFEIGDDVLAKLAIDRLPQSLADALRAMEDSQLVHDALGEHIFEWFLRNKWREWREYKTHVVGLRDQPLPEVAVDHGHRRRVRSAGGVQRVRRARARPHARPRRLPLEGRRHRRRGGRGRAGGRVGRRRSSTRPSDSVAAWAFIRGFRKSAAAASNTRLLVLIGGAHLGDLELRDELFDDFCLLPFHPSELEVRVRHLLWRSGADPQPDVVEYRDLTLNVATYQAAIAGRPLDLTYMEYELLKFLSQNPGKVFTREVLLNRVWGYEYYGGARTVDVHVRRLRAKLGEEHASLIETVRSVGYRFGQARWSG